MRQFTYIALLVAMGCSGTQTSGPATGTNSVTTQAKSPEGKWSSPGAESVMEFRPDGTIYQAMGGEVIRFGKWQVIDPGVVQIEMDAELHAKGQAAAKSFEDVGAALENRPSKFKPSSNISRSKFRIEGDNMILTDNENKETRLMRTR